jgi:hypothetical protein
MHYTRITILYQPPMLIDLLRHKLHEKRTFRRQILGNITRIVIQEREHKLT